MPSRRLPSRRLPSRSSSGRLTARRLTFAAALGLAAAALAGCSMSPGAWAGDEVPPAGPSATASVDTVAARPGEVLRATGAYDGQVVGTFKCSTTGGATVISLTAGPTSMVVRAVGGKVVEGAYLAQGRDFGGPIATPGQGGTVAVQGTSATLTDVRIPSRNGGEPMVLNGTVTCH